MRKRIPENGGLICKRAEARCLSFEKRNTEKSRVTGRAETARWNIELQEVREIGRAESIQSFKCEQEEFIIYALFYR